MSAIPENESKALLPNTTKNSINNSSLYPSNRPSFNFTLTASGYIYDYRHNPWWQKHRDARFITMG
jgi:hypothetical protein